MLKNFDGVSARRYDQACEHEIALGRVVCVEAKKARNAWYLGDDLAEDGDDRRGQSEPHQPGGELGHHDRQQRVHGYIAQKQSAEEQIAVGPDRLNFLPKEKRHVDTIRARELISDSGGVRSVLER